MTKTNLNAKEFQKNLLNWYDKNARILPWRANKNPYFIWVSEIMLQQTRVEAVKVYFERFIREVPTVQALADLSDEKLMKLWQGLGYYRRASNLKLGAIQVVEEFGGIMPKSAEELRKLSGIGEYTAGAIASIAYDEKVPAIDGNVIRVFARLCAIQNSVDDKATKTQIQQIVNSVLPDKRNGDFNQALMEIGATVCLPNGSPLCEQCPFYHICIARQKNLTEQIPVKAEKSERKVENRTVFLLNFQNSFAVTKRPSKGLLANLWEFPNTIGHLTKDQAIQYLTHQQMGTIQSIQPLPAAKHIFTHIEWHMKAYLVTFSSLPQNSPNPANLSQTIQSIIPNSTHSNASIAINNSDFASSLTWATPSALAQTYSIPNAFNAYKKFVK